jgi:hypothetical protein
MDLLFPIFKRMISDQIVHAQIELAQNQIFSFWDGVCVGHLGLSTSFKRLEYFE